jgi:hypothetical protein
VAEQVDLIGKKINAYTTLVKIGLEKVYLENEEQAGGKHGNRM